MQEEIEKTIEILKRGGLVLYPTDTVWGVGCDATNAAAVEKILKLKQSTDRKSMIVLVGKLDDVARYFKRVPEVAWQLLEVTDKPLTLVLPTACGVADNLIAEDGSLGIRVPAHEFCEKLLRRFGRPIVSTSANISGKATPLHFAEIANEIQEGVDHIVDRSFQGKPSYAASSIIKLGEGGQISIIRE